MRIFQTASGNIGKICVSSHDDTHPTTLWLVPDCLHMFHWQHVQERSIDWDTVTDVTDLSQVGYTEIDTGVYMKTNEIQTHRKNHDPTVSEVAPEHAMFTRARDDTEFVRDIHTAVNNWPQNIPYNSMGRRLWETINRIAQRAALDEDNKRFLSVSGA